MMRRGHRLSALTFVLLLSGTFPCAAETKAWGWRGDGTGKFPEADPPVRWERISAVMKGMRAQAARPKGEDAGAATPVRYGTFDTWLLLGPLNHPPTAAGGAEPTPLADEAGLQPDVGDTVNARPWRVVRADGAMLDFNVLFQRKDLSATAVYAHTYVHSTAGGRVLMRMKGTPFKVWLNGEALPGRGKRVHSSHPVAHVVTLKRGWNRLLVRVLPSTRRIDRTEAGRALFELVMHGDETPDHAETTGIAWSVEPPQAYRMSCAQPLIVGDRVIVNSDPEFLVCYRKRDGKFLWVTYNGFYETATQEERQKHPELFKQMDPAAKRLKELLATFKGTLAEKKELDGLVRLLPKLMFKVDPAKYRWVARRQEAGVSGLTSCSDGKFIYTWFAGGVSTCHDLEGNRKWITLMNEGPFGARGRVRVPDSHGFKVSPFLAGDDFVVSMKGMMGLDRETGAVRWRLGHRKPYPPPDGTLPLADGGKGHIEYYHVALYKPGHGFFANSWATRDGNRIYRHRRQGARDGPLLEVYTLGDRVTPTTKLPRRILRMKQLSPDSELKTPGFSWGIHMVVANVLVHEGLITLVTTNGILHVIDAETLQPVYEKHLDLGTITQAYPYPHGSGVCASPTLGGKYIYLWGNGGATLVIKPGRTYEVVAKNRIERMLPGAHEGAFVNVTRQGRYPECTVSCPVFEGKRIYYRAEGTLYCIGGK